MCHASDSIGKPITYPHGITGMLEDIGFAVESVDTIPILTWEAPKRELRDPRCIHLAGIARWFLTAMGRSYQDPGVPEVKAYSSLSMALFTRIAGWTAQQVEQLQEELYRDISDPSVHLYFHL